MDKYPINYLNLERLWAELESSFRATRKLRILSRDEDVLADLLEEQNIAQSTFATGDAATASKMSNAHYLVLPKVQDFHFDRAISALPNFESKFLLQDSGLLQLTVQMVDTTSRKIAQIKRARPL